MSLGVSLALYSGFAACILYLVARTVRHRGLHWPATDIFEAAALVFLFLPVPALVQIMSKALGSQTLPIFNDTEDRAIIVIGAAVIAAAIAFGFFIGVKRAVRKPKRAPTGAGEQPATPPDPPQA